MINFETEIENLLPYNRKQYISLRKWYGISFQLSDVFEGKDIGLEVFLENYENWVKNIISTYDNDSFWIVNHADKDLKWFPNDEDTLISLRTLFKQNNIPNNFKGALILSKDDLLKYVRDIISYPYAVFSEKCYLYGNLDISHGQLQFVIKISGHLTIDLLSTDKEFLRKIILDKGLPNGFIIKEYKGTKL